MKQLSKLILTAALLLTCSFTFAQTQKFGYISSSELIMSMPEYKDAMAKLKEYETELTSQLEAIQVEFNNKFADYQKNLSTLTDVVRKAKESELSSIQDRLQQNSEKMSQDFQAMQAELIAPISEKAQNAINEVGKANNLIIVFDTDTRAMIYYDEKTMVNVLPLVKTKLGIKE